jgi:hypothetical protein
MSAKLATKPSRALLTQLESMLDEVQTPECRHWLEQELEGYSLCSHLPWYRIVACRQRGHFLDLKTGKYLTCHINSQTLSQRDLAQIQFIYAREPAAHYLLQRNSGIEPWPKQLLEEMDGQTILEKYSQEKDGIEKTELAAMMLLKMAEDTENIVPKARLRQEGLYLLKYVQEHGNTYSLPRNLLIQFLHAKQ